MSPLFGHKDDPPAEAPEDDAALLAADIERLDSLPLSQLGAEVMVQGFGPNGPGGPGKPGTIEAPAIGAVRVGLSDVARVVSPAYVGRGVGPDLQMRFTSLVAEGLQILENAGLVRVTWDGGHENYIATRLGRAAVERGTVDQVIAGGDV